MKLWKAVMTSVSILASALGAYSCINPLQKIIERDITPKSPEIEVKGPNGMSIVSGGGSSYYPLTPLGSSNTATFTIENTGNIDLHLTGSPVPVLLGGEDTSHFSISLQPVSTVHPSESTVFTVWFTPSGGGTKTALLSISNDDADENPYNFSLVGNQAASPEITIKYGSTVIPNGAGSYEFAAAQVGNSNDVILTIENLGTDNLVLAGSPRVQVIGPSASDFIVSQQPSSPVEAMGNASFTLCFSPTSYGSKSVTVSIMNNDGDENPYVFSLLGAAYVGDIRISDYNGHEGTPSLVWAGSGYGLAWHELYGDPSTFWSSELYFTALNYGGKKVVDDVLLSPGIPYVVDPSLAWTGTEYGIVWRDQRNGNKDIYFTRISQIGTKQGADVRITNSTFSSETPHLVWTGTEYGLAWYDYRDGNYEIYFARISSTGQKLAIPDPEPDGVNDDYVRITNDPSNSSQPSLVWTGAQYGISWIDDRDGDFEIYFARLSSEGVKQGGDVLITNDASHSWWPSIVWTGTEYGLAWYDYRNGSNSEIYFARINSNGVKQGSDVRVTNDLTGGSRFPSLIWTGTEYGLTWIDGRDGCDRVFFARLDSTGQKISVTDPEPDGVNDDEVPITSSTWNTWYPVLAWTGIEYGLAWIDNRYPPQTEVFFTILDSNGIKK